ncbi:UNVERIFIED_CONTAM: hypothetical protein GTU68_001947 [Idotea baltica]|nr:hypothetical protein [Idotea baltica]
MPSPADGRMRQGQDGLR